MKRTCAPSLPQVYGITAAALCPSIDNFLGRLDKALAHGGLRMLQVRDKSLPPAERSYLAQECVRRARPHNCAVLVNDDIDLAHRIGATGIHLSSARLTSLRARPAGWPLVGASVHNLSEARQACERLKLDLVVLSPVRPTPSHHAALVLGWAGFAAIAQNFTTQFYALGGLSEEDLAQALAHGAHGVASMRALWSLPTKPSA